LHEAEHEFIFMFVHRIAALGLAIWLIATALLRLAGQYFVPGTVGGVLVLFGVSFPAMAWLARVVCRRANLPHADWLRGAAALAAPTLLLDPFTSAFFRFVFPNIRPELAGVFGGWMLCCVAGALAGAARPR
jgi:asparagine N-glycosylation enzyme membrane subunit Stt3